MIAVEPHQDTDRLSQLCKALANPVRVEIVRFVQRHPRCIGNEILLQLPEETTRAQSTLSQHLKVLCAAGLLEAEPDGAATCYEVNQAQLDWLRQQVAALML